jgi:hypothetical protein
MTPDRSIRECLETSDSRTAPSAARRRADKLVDAAYAQWRSQPCADAYEAYLAAERSADTLTEASPGFPMPSAPARNTNRLVGVA